MNWVPPWVKPLHGNQCDLSSCLRNPALTAVKHALNSGQPPGYSPEELCVRI